MSIGTTITLDEDVLERVKRESRTRGTSFRDTLNDLLRTALLQHEKKPRRRKLKINPIHMGYRLGLNYEDVESLLEYGEVHSRQMLFLPLLPWRMALSSLQPIKTSGDSADSAGVNPLTQRPNQNA